VYGKTLAVDTSTAFLIAPASPDSGYFTIKKRRYFDGSS